VLSVKQKAGRCRLRETGQAVTLRAGRLWDVVPGEIAVVRPRKQWSYARNLYLSGEVERTRLDLQALGLAALKLESRDTWNPAEHYWGMHTLAILLSIIEEELLAKSGVLWSVVR
jgi:hypothetical protein